MNGPAPPARRVSSSSPAFLVLGILGLATSGLGLLAERRIERRGSEPRDPPETD